MPVVTLSKLNSVVIDTYVDENNPTSSSLSSTTLRVGKFSTSTGYRNRSLIKFDLGLIPNDAVINSATLKFYQTLGDSTNADMEIRAHLITQDWTNPTWNVQPGYSPSVYGAITLNNYSATNNYFTIDVKTIVQQWISGQSANFGLLLKHANETTVIQRTLASSEDASYYPTLIIDYTIPSTGKKCVEYVGSRNQEATNATGMTITAPTGALDGDLLLLQVNTNSSTATVTIPNGWIKVHDQVNGGARQVFAYKFMSAGDSTINLSASASVNWGAFLHSFRNVKSVLNYTSSGFTGSSSAPPSISVSKDKVMNVLLMFKGYVQGVTPPLSYHEELDGSLQVGQFFLAYRYMHTTRSQAPSDMTVTFSTSSSGSVAAIALEPKTNNPPTLTLTNPTDNQTLAEGNTLPVEGTAGDTDNGNVVTVKYRINGGTARAIASGVSDGSSPLSFARTLTYSNKRIWDGSTDVAGVDLAEGVDHTLTVWAEDDQGGKSAEITRKFRVIWNRPPTISGENGDLGTILLRPTITYSAVDPEGNSFTFTEYLNGQQVRSFAGEAGQEYTFQLTHDAWIRLDLDVPHQVKIVATDSAGISSERVYTFTRTETHIEFMLDYENPEVQAFFTVDGMPNRILVTLERYLPPGAAIESVLVTNNYLDAEPTWEDATGAVIGGRGYLFTNTTKTADDWAVCVWVTIAKGSADQRVHVYGYGGAFD